MEQTSSKRIGFFDVWKNPELKNTVRFFIISFFLFSLLIGMGIYYLGQQYKTNDIESKAAIIGSLLHQHPELEDELVANLNKKISNHEKQMGMEILSDYGISSNLPMKFFPEITDFFRSLTIFSIIVFLLFFISLFFFYNQYSRIMYRRIRYLTFYADEVLEGRAHTPLQEIHEGDLSKLTHSFNRMRFVIQKNIAELKKEKSFLVDLMSDISHQLKTPLASLSMYNEIMSEKELSKEQKTMFLEQGKQQLERMNWLIQSLLKLAKLDVGAIQFQKRKASLTQTVRGSVEILKELATQKGVHVQVVSTQEYMMIHDKDWMTEALLNVIKNAIEHTPKDGHVSISMEESAALLKIHIQDQGEGIDREEIKNIFKRFYKGKKNKKPGSVGIGLSLSKSIIEGHHGIIQVESKLKSGTTFTFVFSKDTNREGYK
ncbi:sensor histidine kinase [Heyndrickxia sporothermodurans]